MKIEQSTLEEFNPYREDSENYQNYQESGEKNKDYEEISQEALRKIKKFLPKIVKLANSVAKSNDPRLGIEHKYEEPLSDLTLDAWQDELVSILGVDPGKRLWAVVMGAILAENMMIRYEIRKEKEAAPDVTIVQETKNGKSYYDQQ